MDFLTYSKKLERICFLAERKMTGNASELANRLEVSKRTAERMIETLRLKGIKIKYCRIRKTYTIEK